MIDIKPYKIAAFDLDGTLLNSKKELTPQTKAAMEFLQAQGVQIVLASGRHNCGIAPLAEELDLPRHGGFLLCFNGGKIIECKTGAVIYNETMQLADTQEAILRARQLGVAVVTYTDDTLLTEDPQNEYVQLEARLSGVRIHAVKDLALHVNFPVNKVLLAADADVLPAVDENLKQLMGSRCTVCPSTPNFLEIVPKGVTKQRALSSLLARYGLTRESLVAFGDGMNDRGMVEFAGMGVAMGNAAQEVKLAADLVTDSCDEEGISRAIHTIWRNSANLSERP